MDKSKVLNVHFKSKDPVGAGLSNLSPWPFILDNVACASMEGFLQSLKTALLEPAREIRKLAGIEAWRRGQEYNGWQKTQELWWRGILIGRQGGEYQALLDRAYDAWYLQNDGVGALLRRSVGRQLRHLRGNHDTRHTVLTESEYVSRLERLRWVELTKPASIELIGS